jgi:23S rRNA pseudouridine1911/1915/1917 synthase
MTNRRPAGERPRRRHVPQALPLDVLFEDDDIMAVGKTAGVVAHPSYKHPDGSVFNALLWHLRGTGVHPRLLHRLDKDTSGVMLVSKTMSAHAAMVRAMRPGAAGGVRKEYLAVVRGVPAPPAGEIDLRLRRDPADSRRMTASDTEGQASLTRYATLAPSPEHGVSALLCELVTGRMHQIRVHLAARGWPVVGDPVYGAGAGPGDLVARQALHAWRVSFTHPVSGAPLVVTAPCPADLRAVLELTGAADGISSGLARGDPFDRG